MYVTKFVSNTKYGQSSIMEFAGYLEKESIIQGNLPGASSRELSAYLDKQNDVVRVEGHEYFFNGSGNTYDCEDVTKAIDSNVKGLKKTEARYYTFSISPSRPEIAHLQRTIADTKQALSEAGEVLPESFEEDVMRHYLKDYALQCMDGYAQNFGHEQIKDNKDLLWFGMVEKDRYWKSHDAEVRTNSKIDKKIEAVKKQLGTGRLRTSDAQLKIAELEKSYIREHKVRPGGSNEILRAMMPKAGDNWHIHIAVSRRDITNSINLSPNANSRGSAKHQLNGQSVRVGFDREAYKVKCEEQFDNQFSNNRLLTESYAKAKELRSNSIYNFQKQLYRDRATRSAEAVAFAQMKARGYGEYYENLMRAERLDARQLAQLKGHLVRQIHRLNPALAVDELQEYTLDELQREFVALDANNEFSIPGLAKGVATNIGDKTIQVTGLQGYHPIRTSQKVLKAGIAMNKAVNRRREVYDQWFGIYSEEWFRGSYTFDSISERRNVECLLAQTEFLQEQLGQSVILANAQEYIRMTEQRIVSDFLNEFWPEWQQELSRQYAIEVFGQDGVNVHSKEQFEVMARERLLPEEARKNIATLTSHTEQPRGFETLRERFADLPRESLSSLSEKLEVTIDQQGAQLEAVQNTLRDQTLSVNGKEEALLSLNADSKAFEKTMRTILFDKSLSENDKVDALLKLAQNDKIFCKAVKAVLADSRLSWEAKEKVLLMLAEESKVLNRSLKDIRNGILNVFEKQNPEIKPGTLHEILAKLLENLREVRANRYAEFTAEINGFIAQELPGYHVVVEKQTQLEQLLQEITPDKEKYAERLLKVNNELSKQLSPEAEKLFAHHSQRLFGPEVQLRNEQEFVSYVDEKFSAELAANYKRTLPKVYAQIEERRRVLIQNYVQQYLTSKELESVEQQQNYINRFINKKFSVAEAKHKKEELQRRVAKVCRRPVGRDPEYKILDHVTQKRIATQAMTKANQVKVIPITPQQVVFKVATKLINILTKGY